MKKTIIAILCTVFIASLLFTGCGTVDNGENTTVVASIYPIYDWIRELTKDTGIDVKLLVNGGSDIHSYQPTFSDIAVISRADLFVYVGGESDAWVENVAENDSGNGYNLRLLAEKGITTYAEELTEGMQREASEDVSGDDEGPETDEHIWLSLKAASACINIIKDKLCEISPENSEKILKNAEAYTAEIDSLYAKQLAEAEKYRGKTMIFADRFPFRYLAEEFGFKYSAPFPGCSAETEASFETVAVLTEKVSGLGAQNVFVLNGNDGKLAKTIAPKAGILTLDSLETRGEKSYLDAMSENFQTILKGLY